jgi:hypothetical protein
VEEGNGVVNRETYDMGVAMEMAMAMAIRNPISHLLPVVADG